MVETESEKVVHVSMQELLKIRQSKNSSSKMMDQRHMERDLQIGLLKRWIQTRSLGQIVDDWDRDSLVTIKLGIM